MYGGLGMSAPSLHRESTDSLISLRKQGEKKKLVNVRIYMCSNVSNVDFLNNLWNVHLWPLSEPRNQ